MNQNFCRATCCAGHLLFGLQDEDGHHSVKLRGKGQSRIVLVSAAAGWARRSAPMLPFISDKPRLTRTYSNIYIYMYIYIYVYYIAIYLFIYLFMYLFRYLFINVCIHLFTYLYLFVQSFIYSYCDNSQLFACFKTGSILWYDEVPSHASSVITPLPSSRHPGQWLITLVSIHFGGLRLTITTSEVAFLTKVRTYCRRPESMFFTPMATGPTGQTCNHLLLGG